MIPLLIPVALGLIGGYLSREPKKYHLGGDMSKHLAPNGKSSNLTHEQGHLVRTPEFRAWFGDWENDPENASKVVDENGEPLVVYRGTRNNIQNVSGFWLTKSKQYAEGFGEVNEYFVKIFNPMSEEEFNKTWMVDFTKYDGRLGDFHKIVVKDIIQIKLADGTNTTFDPENPDIRYAKGGKIGNDIKLGNVTLKVDYAKEQDFDEIYDLVKNDIGYVGHPRLVLTENNKIIGAIYKEKYTHWKTKEEIKDAEYKFDIVIKKSKRGKGYAKYLLDAMIYDFVYNYPNSDQIRGEVVNKKLEKYLESSRYDFSCNDGNQENIMYCYLPRKDAIKLLKKLK